MKRLLMAATVCLFAVSAVAQDHLQGAPAGQEGGQRAEGRGGMRMMMGGGNIGTLKEIKDANTWIVENLDGKQITVKLSAETRLLKNMGPAKAADYKVGDPVAVGGEPDASGVIAARGIFSNPGMLEQAKQMRENMGKTFIAGEIKAIDETKLTIHRPDGQDQTIELDDSTSLMRQGQSITLADVKVGEQVAGPGALKNGVFVPTRLNVGMNRMMMRREGGPAQGGQGGAVIMQGGPGEGQGQTPPKPQQ